MKLFISQPMNGKSEEQIIAERKRVFDLMQAIHPDEKVELISSYFEDNPPKDCNSGLYHLGKSLELLATSDIVYFVSGWQDYRGCKIEHEATVAYGLHYFEE